MYSLVRAGNEQKTRVELLKENNTLATETTSQKDQDGTGGDGSTKSSLGRGLAANTGLHDILGRVVLGSLVGGSGNVTGLSVGLATNLLLGVGGSDLLGGNGRGLLS